MKIEEVFCVDCYEWKKQEDLVESQQHTGELYCKECGAVLIRTDEYNRMKRYQVVGFDDTISVFGFTVMAKNFSEALRAIEKDYYMTDMNFYKLEITEVEK
jgi:hypothetical protein